ncbi:MAG: flagellar hook-associated protein 3 [Desulfobulbaceae bacterium A2]|nr:MAG: flagellar hook-associated protein 3 [Desulfobulbaceae bacterium A2]
MKATQGTTYRMLGGRLNTLSNELEELRNIASSGKKLNRASDDPSSVRPVLTARKQLSDIARHLDTMQQALDKSSSTDSYLEHVEDVLVRVKELAIAAANDALDSEGRDVLAGQVRDMRQELLDAANASVDGKFIFAGYRETTKPFTANPGYVAGGYDPTSSATWPYLYNGDENATYLEITPGEQVQVNLTGNELFLGDADNNGVVDAGRIDLFAVVTNVMEAIDNDDLTTLEGEIDNLDVAADQNRRLRSQLGNRAARIESAMDLMQQSKIDVSELLSHYEDADAIEAFNNLTKQETAFEAALNVTSKVSQLSILDFM